MFIEKNTYRDDGTLLKSVRTEYQTEKNWQRKHFKLRRNAVGEKHSWSGPNRKRSAVFYSEKEVLPMTEREIEKYKSITMEQRKMRKRLRKEDI